jgi:hypothetical protein
VKNWLAAAGITEGALFRRVGKGGKVLPDRLRAQSVAFIVKAYAARLGLDADAFSGHSLRSGFLTSAAARGASLFKMMDVSRHKSVDVLRGHVRDRFPGPCRGRASLKNAEAGPAYCGNPADRHDVVRPILPHSSHRGNVTGFTRR